MKGQSGKNQGVRMIAQFNDRAISFIAGEPLKANDVEKRSANGGIRMGDSFSDPAESIEKQTPPRAE